MQRFVEDHLEKIFHLEVISSTRRGGRPLFDIDVLAISSSNTPVIIECKWDRVDAAALDQLAAYSLALQQGWTAFETRVSETRRRAISIAKREPILVAIGYRYDGSVLHSRRSVICVTYAYHGVAFADGIVEQRRRGQVSIQPAREADMTPSPPRILKRYATEKRLACLPQNLRAGFCDVHERLLALDGVREVPFKNVVNYHAPRGQFAEAKIGAGSIEWNFGKPPRWSEAWRSVEMRAASDAEKVFRQVRRAYRDAG
ncbi:MAG: hypothetical protein HYU25_12570 [Candidatus Rokubacteria bacterium]|nr:hypothetical protein [Candidatus Rokubacteria bacterium]